MKKEILLFTEFFPFGANSEQAFVQNEINYLFEKFDSVTVFPSIIDESRTSFGNYNVDTTLANSLQKKTKLKYIFLALKNKFFYKDLFLNRLTFWNYSKLKRLIYYTANAQIVSDWFKNYLKGVKTNTKLIVYTFWNNEITLGLASLVHNKDNFVVVSRAHGHDIFENYYSFNYIPCYKYNLRLLHKLYLVSEPPIEYILKNYSIDRKKLKKIHLGVKKAVKINQSSSDGIIRIVSCSYIIPAKRVDLILKGILKYIEQTNHLISWTHFGSERDSGMDNVLKEIKKIKTDKLNYSFKGFCLNQQVLNFYETEPVDLFTSMVEGGVPVSIQEAQSFGIPVIATKVGGIPEIINENVGILLDANPSDNEIAQAIKNILSDKQKYIKLRENSFLNWEKNFNEKINFDLFASEIYNLI